MEATPLLSPDSKPQPGAMALGVPTAFGTNAKSAEA